MNEIEKQVLKKVKPNKKERERVKNTGRKLVEEVKERLDLEYEPRIVGSVAKDTFLKDPDIDVFVLFPLDVEREKMENLILEVGRDLLEDIVEKYAEHPYIHGKYDGYKVDIVPCYKLKDISEMKSAVDRTPFHTDYIIENLSEDKKDDVRLLKAFLEGIGAYGAESRVWGFSGYLCELLVLHYGGFQEVLENALDWRMYTRIEIVESEADFEDPLVVIDPVDPDRNVASALSEEKMFLFVYASKRYLDEPRKTFFLPNKRKEKSKRELKKDVKERGTYITGIKFPRPNVVEDNLYPQVQKANKKLVHQLGHLDFTVLHSDYFVKDDEIWILFELKEKELPLIEKHLGPPIWSNHTEPFKEKYDKEVYIEEDRLMVDRPRKYTTVEDAIVYITEEINLGSKITPMLPEELQFYDSKEIIEEQKTIMNEFLDRTFPWER